jgi:hypothetical protein
MLLNIYGKDYNMLSMKSGTVTQLGLFNDNHEELDALGYNFSNYMTTMNLHVCREILPKIMNLGIAFETDKLRDFYRLLVAHCDPNVDGVYIHTGYLIVNDYEVKIPASSYYITARQIGYTTTYKVDMFEDFLSDCTSKGINYYKDSYDSVTVSVPVAIFLPKVFRE